MVHTWALKYFLCPMSLLLGLSIYHSGTWSLWEPVWAPDAFRRDDQVIDLLAVGDIVRTPALQQAGRFRTLRHPNKAPVCLGCERILVAPSWYISSTEPQAAKSHKWMSNKSCTRLRGLLLMAESLHKLRSSSQHVYTKQMRG